MTPRKRKLKRLRNWDKVVHESKVSKKSTLARLKVSEPTGEPKLPTLPLSIVQTSERFAKIYDAKGELLKEGATPNEVRAYMQSLNRLLAAKLRP